jgi:hypothetical protein
MAATKIQTGPTTAEIVLGSALSLLLGVLLVSLYLVLKPVEVVREMPEAPAVRTVYWLEGRKDAGLGRRWLFKREAFLQGQTVTLSEDELNLWIASVYPPRPASAAKSGSVLDPAAPAFRVDERELAIGIACKLNVYGLLQRELVVQAVGDFGPPRDRGPVFRPREFYIGSLPVHRLPLVAGWLGRWVEGFYVFPEDLSAAWSRIVDAQVQDGTLVLTAAAS